MPRRPHSAPTDEVEQEAAEPDEFERLFRELHAPLCDVAHHYVRSRAVAEEIVQDVFFALWRSGGGQDVRTVRAYLFTAVRNGAIGCVRREGVSRRWVAQAEHGLAPNAMSQPAPSADARVQSTETARAVQRAIASLPPRTRLALVLRWGHSLSHAAVAEAMGISVKGVEKLVAGAMTKLRRHLTDDAREPEDAAVPSTR